MTVSQAAPELLELDITALAAGGDGVGRVDGLAVFVPRTAPGDRVQAAVTRHGRFGRGVVDAFLTESALRVRPPCVHFTRDDCGSCQWQHLGIAAQRAAKAQLVVDAFARIAHRDVPRPAVTGDQEVLAYRRTISVTVRGRGRRRVGGFRTVYSPDELFAVERCLLAHPELQECWLGVRTQLAALPVPEGARGRPELRVTLRRDNDGAVALIVEGGRTWTIERAAAIAARAPSLQSVWWRPLRGELVCLWHTDDAGAETTSFVQVNAGVAALMHAHLRELVARCRRADRGDGVVGGDASHVEVMAGSASRAASVASAASAASAASVAATGAVASPRYRVVDGYAGRGDLAVALTGDGCVVVAIERDPVAAAFAAARLALPSHMVAGAVEERLDEALPAELVLLNPPRAGLDPAVTSRLRRPASSPDTPRWLVYVSCDPATLARDVARLEGWEVASLECFDMFPQTAHVETVCLLRPEGQ